LEIEVRREEEGAAVAAPIAVAPFAAEMVTRAGQLHDDVLLGARLGDAALRTRARDVAVGRFRRGAEGVGAAHRNARDVDVEELPPLARVDGAGLGEAAGPSEGVRHFVDLGRPPNSEVFGDVGGGIVVARLVTGGCACTADGTSRR